MSAGLYGVLNLQAAHQALQWSAGATIVWMGLSIAGLAPAIPGFDRLLALFDESMRRGCTWLTLEVRVSNHVAQRLYLKYGVIFEIIN